jgi:hypothetical protein
MTQIVMVRWVRGPRMKETADTASGVRFAIGDGAGTGRGPWLSDGPQPGVASSASL